MRPSEFPTFHVINLEDRPDRWERISAHLNQYGLKVERVNATRSEAGRGWIGATLCHQSCVREAQDLPWVLVLEDDCELTEEFSKSFAKILSDLERNMHGWEFFNGGPYNMDYRDPVKPFILNSQLLYCYGHGTHFALYNKWSYSRILAWTPCLGAIDAFLVDLARQDDSRFRAVAHSNHLAIQHESFSDIVRKEVNYLDSFKQSSARLQRELRNYTDVGLHFRRLKVQNISWRSDLIISGESDFVFSVLHGSRGRYIIEGMKLLVKWDLYGQEIYFDVDGTWIQDCLVLT